MAAGVFTCRGPAVAKGKPSETAGIMDFNDRGSYNNLGILQSYFALPAAIAAGVNFRSSS